MLVSTAFLTLLGLVSGMGLGLAAHVFAVETDPRLEQIIEYLPGANCGGCGFAGCHDFAAAILRGDITPDHCPLCPAEEAWAIGELMGMAVEAQQPMVAMVMCQGSEDPDSRKKFHYNGVATCASLNLLGQGDRLCEYGCLGLGDCQRACPFKAIEITEQGVARVIPSRCTGCGMCLAACPKGIIHLVPEDAPIHVLCSNHDKGGLAKKNCPVACTGCKICEKFCEGEKIRVVDFLAEIDYDNPPQDLSVVGKCPTGALVESGI